MGYIPLVFIITGKKLCATLDPTVYTLKEPTALRLRHLPVNQMNGEITAIALRFDRKIKANSQKSDEILL